MVGKGKPGYGAIHHIAAGKYGYKTELLVVLTIHGNANLDLTTTHHEQMTALHLAVEVSSDNYMYLFRGQGLQRLARVVGLNNLKPVLSYIIIHL